MAYDSIFGSDPSKASFSAARELTHPAEPKFADDGFPAESDLAELAAKFAMHGGGQLSAELSADLALEIVLNEIVEQACLATGATGAAIVLARNGEMTCRASTGVNAPKLGTRLNTEEGLSGACMRTRQLQRCDDAQSDPRADAEASRQLGVRSVMILPLLQENRELAGVFEVFSALPSAFAERDERTLEALSRRVLGNLKRASEPLVLPSNGGGGRAAASEESRESHEPPEAAELPEEYAPIFSAEMQSASPRRGMDAITLVLGVLVLAGAVLLGALIGIRFGWQRSASQRREKTTATLRAPQTEAAAGNTAAVPPGEAAANTNSLPAGAPAAAEKPGAPETKRTAAAGPPAGGLLVSENGKEIFRLEPAEPGAQRADAGAGEVRQAAAVEPTQLVELPPDAVEGNLLHRVEPDYPDQARKQQIQGPVVLDVHIGRSGAVQEVKVVSGDALLAGAAASAVKQWRFKPQMLNGQPAEMQTRVTINFRLPQ